MKKLTRRQFGTGVAATTAAALASASMPRFAFAQTPAAGREFPEGFLWGCATAAYQVEGGAAEDGRGPSVWDTFSHTPGITANGDTGDVADDSYHLYKQDIQLLKNLGVATYRMSISWSRIFPTGTGQPNPKGLDYYNRVVDELLANKITPYITLFHWDLPAALPGGWQSRDTSKAFAEYAAYVTRHLGDKRPPLDDHQRVCLLHRPRLQGRPFRPRPQTPARPGQPGPPPRHPCPRTSRPGHSRQHPHRNPGRPRGECRRLCPRHRDRRAHRGRPQSHHGTATRHSSLP